MASITIIPGVVFGSLSPTAISYSSTTREIPLAKGDTHVLAILTGREMIARSFVEGLAFKISRFSIGTGGYDPTVLNKALPVDTSLTDLTSPLFEDAVDLVETPNDSGRSFYCRLQPSEANNGLGEIGIWGEIVYSPSNPSEVGNYFLFAIANQPFEGKNEDHIYIYRIVVQY